MTMIDLTPLQAMAMPLPPTIREMIRTGRTERAVAGLFGTVLFNVTQDADGHTEASLSVVGPIKPSDGMVAAFFEVWPRSPAKVVETPAEGCRHFVVEALPRAN